MWIDFEDLFHPELIKKYLKDDEKEPKVINGIGKILELLKNEGETEILLTGGGIIPKEDMEKLELLGVGKLFGPGSSVKESLSYIESWFKENKKDI